jgi:uncharacterized protein (TIGR02217 family)
MNGFHDVSLPANLARIVRGGPVDSTELIAFADGREARVQARARLRRRYTFSAGDLGPEEAYALLAFFEARRGRLFGFRLRDPIDHRSCGPLADPSAVDQLIGTGDGVNTAFALKKTYADAAGAAVRRVSKPEPGSVRVSVGAGELDPAGFSCDPATGLVTLARAPAQGALVRAGFRFDVPVRFDVERLDLPMMGRGGADKVALVEADL